ncbi:MAG: HEPN domain-containing protein [Pirellulales bacterium]
MASTARQTLGANKADLDRLWELHEQETGKGAGRRFYVEVLNKSVVVLVCASWEAFCEDIAREAIQHIVDDCADWSKLPDELKTLIAQQLRDDKHDHAPWRLAGDGWKAQLMGNANRFISDTTSRWNTPKSKQVKELFEKTIGISDITADWNWQNSTVKQSSDKLDEFVALRGEIAHRLKPVDSVHKKHGTDFFELISRLADKVDASVRTLLHTVTGKNYW